MVEHQKSFAICHGTSWHEIFIKANDLVCYRLIDTRIIYYLIYACSASLVVTKERDRGTATMHMSKKLILFKEALSDPKTMLKKQNRILYYNKFSKNQ